jgi:hypothetical protein
LATGFTGETANLNFGPTAPASSAPGPAVIFSEGTGTSVAACVAATTVGDTHFDTFHGLFYDFQASGDFLLAEVGADFLVQARQASGAPTWPNTSVNKAVATQMGRSRVAICLGEKAVHIDGQHTNLSDGQVHSLPTGVDITRRGNTYFVTDQSGNSLRADVHAQYIDATVGLGRWPSDVRGLLGNVNGNVMQVAARDGTVLTAPFALGDLYGKYGESWRVPMKDSLLNVCGPAQPGNPTDTFYANDLDRETYDRTRAVCLAAGVKAGPLLNACTLDVAVLGDDAAAKVFVDARPPVAEGIITRDGGRSGSGRWCDILLGLLLLASLWLALGRKLPQGPTEFLRWALILISWAVIALYITMRLKG